MSDPEDTGELDEPEGEDRPHPMAVVMRSVIAAASRNMTAAELSMCIAALERAEGTWHDDEEDIYLALFRTELKKPRPR